MINPKYILTDIEGTTSAIAFVHDVLFPYFINHATTLEQLWNSEMEQEIVSETISLAKEEGIVLNTNKEVINQLINWAKEDKKITPLKTAQGILWKDGYEKSEIKGHVYEDVEPAFVRWKKMNIPIGIFSSGSVQAQKLLFKHSVFGDLDFYIDTNFDTKTGGKRDVNTYIKIADLLSLKPSEILFLSDIIEEVVAADNAGYQVVQVLRDEKQAEWNNTAITFDEIVRDNKYI